MGIFGIMRTFLIHYLFSWFLYHRESFWSWKAPLWVRRASLSLQGLAAADQKPRESGCPHWCLAVLGLLLRSWLHIPLLPRMLFKNSQNKFSLPLLLRGFLAHGLKALMSLSQCHKWLAEEIHRAPFLARVMLQITVQLEEGCIWTQAFYWIRGDRGCCEWLEALTANPRI